MEGDLAVALDNITVELCRYNDNADYYRERTEKFDREFEARKVALVPPLPATSDAQFFLDLMCGVLIGTGIGLIIRKLVVNN